MDPMTMGRDAINGGVVLVFGMCVLLPLGAIAAVVWYAMRRARLHHDERVAMIHQGLVPPPLPPGVPPVVAPRSAARRAAAPRDPRESIGWAVGLLAAGIVWFVGDFIAAILIGLGAAYMTRGVFGLKRESDAAGPPSTPGGIS